MWLNNNKTKTKRLIPWLDSARRVIFQVHRSKRRTPHCILLSRGDLTVVVEVVRKINYTAFKNNLSKLFQNFGCRLNIKRVLCICLFDWDAKKKNEKDKKYARI